MKTAKSLTVTSHLKNGFELGEIEGFIKALDDATSLDQVFDLALHEITKLGFEELSYQLMFPPDGPRTPFYLSSFPKDWVKHYIAKKYISVDNVGLHALKVTRPFLWDDFRNRKDLTSEQKLLFNESFEVGLKKGATIPIHSIGNTKALFSISNRYEIEDFEQLFMMHRHALQLILGYAHEGIIHMGIAETCRPVNPLTPTEIELLTWTARGKTAGEIAEILSKSEGTIKTQIFSVCDKLGVHNKTHAAVIAVMHKLIIP